MGRNRDDLAESFGGGKSEGGLTSFLAEEEEFDRRALWRLGSWAVGSVAAVTVAILASQSSISSKRDQIAAADLERQSLQIQRVAKDSQTEARRLASAIDTLNGDRDRLYSRVTTLEQGLDSVTGAIGRQSAAVVAPPPAAISSAPSEAPAVKPAEPVQAAAPVAATPAPAPIPAPPPAPAAVASIPAAMNQAASNPVAEPAPAASTPIAPPTPPAALVPIVNAAPPQTAAPERNAAASPAMPLMAAKSFMAPPDPAAAKLVEPPPEPSISTAATEPQPDLAVSEALAVPAQRTEFGVDIGGANNIEGLRALWLRLVKSNKALEPLRPIIVIKERPNGGGMQLRLVAGPLRDAGLAAKLCANLNAGERTCEATVFDGQRLAIGGPATPAAAPSRAPRRRSSSVREVPEAPPPPPPKPSSLISLLGF